MGEEMSTLLFLHIVCVSLWAGCILVEAIYEHSIDDSDLMRVFLSKLHWNTDKYVEIPAFLGVLATGAVMLAHVEITALLLIKVVFGLIAIVFNAVCVGLVIKRLGYAKSGDFVRWQAVDHKQHKFGGVVLIALLIALGIGGHLFVAAAR